MAAAPFFGVSRLSGLIRATVAGFTVSTTGRSSLAGTHPLRRLPRCILGAHFSIECVPFSHVARVKRGSLSRRLAYLNLGARFIDNWRTFLTGRTSLTTAVQVSRASPPRQLPGVSHVYRTPYAGLAQDADWPYVCLGTHHGGGLLAPFFRDSRLLRLPHQRRGTHKPFDCGTVFSGHTKATAAALFSRGSPWRRLPHFLAGTHSAHDCTVSPGRAVLTTPRTPITGRARDTTDPHILRGSHVERVPYLPYGAHMRDDWSAPSCRGSLYRGLARIALGTRYLADCRTCEMGLSLLGTAALVPRSSLCWRLSHFRDGAHYDEQLWHSHHGSHFTGG